MLTKLAKQIEEALNGLRTGIQAKYDAARAKFEILETELNALKARERLAEASGYKEFDDARQEVAHARHVRDVLEMRHLQEQIEMRIPRTIIEVIERAVPANEKSPVSPNFLLNVVLSIVLGIGCGIGLAYFVEYMDTSVKTIEDVERSLGVAVLGVIPRGVKPLVSEGPQSSHAEAYRVLRTNIQFSKRMVTGKALTCTSGSVGEGKSLTIFNLAYVSAQLGERVLIVDSDLHRPRQHKILGVSNKVGLTNVLIGEADLDEVIQRTPQPNLDLLPSGRMSSGTHGLLDTSKMREVITTLRERYDRIYFDAPPIIGVSDATLLAREMDGVLLVVQHRKYPRAISLRAKSMLEHTGANLLGVVLNNINISRDYSYYYYHYTSHYHRKDAEEAKEAKA
jgi:capsular exopolysaccharide synthesis family protein